MKNIADEKKKLGFNGKSFTVYNSFFEMYLQLKRPEDRDAFIQRLCNYGLYGEDEPSDSELVELAFTGCKENVNSAIRKRHSHKPGGTEEEEIAQDTPTIPDSKQAKETAKLVIDYYKTKTGNKKIVYDIPLVNTIKEHIMNGKSFEICKEMIDNASLDMTLHDIFPQNPV